MSNNNWVPEIMYEEEDGISGGIPFIAVPSDKEMPKVIFIFESRETGEFEPGLDGDPLPIVDMELHQYADMVILKNSLDEETYDKVRHVLGLKPLRKAAEMGKEITNNVRKNLNLWYFSFFQHIYFSLR